MFPCRGANCAPRGWLAATSGWLSIPGDVVNKKKYYQMLYDKRSWPNSADTLKPLHPLVRNRRHALISSRTIVASCVIRKSGTINVGRK